MKKGCFRPTEAEYVAYLEDVRRFNGGEPLPSQDEVECCRILSAVEEGLVAPEDVLGVAGNEAVVALVGEAARTQMLIKEFISALRGRR